MAEEESPKMARLRALAPTLSSLGGLIAGVAGLITALTVMFRAPSPGPKQAYELLSDDIKKLNAGVQQNHEDLIALSNWMDGYVRFAEHSYAPPANVNPMPPKPVTTGARTTPKTVKPDGAGVPDLAFSAYPTSSAAPVNSTTLMPTPKPPAPAKAAPPSGATVTW